MRGSVLMALVSMGLGLRGAGLAQGMPQRAAAPQTTKAVGNVTAGTTVHIRLGETVSSFGSKADRPVTAMVIQPVRVDGEVVIPLGAELEGTIVKVRRVGLGLASETATVEMEFAQIRLPGGSFAPIALRVTALDNSRETVDGTGTIHGIRATASASKVMSGAAISVASLDPMSLIFGLSASFSAFRVPESEIIMPTGTELTLVTTAPFAVSRTYPAPPAVVEGAEEQEQLVAMARRLPWRTETEGKHEPSDITSILFLGDEAAIVRALEAGGWTRSHALGAQSSFGAARSVVENQGYKEGPVSTLLLAGKPPVGAWSKTLDTFFQRHHLRLFQENAEFGGQPVFVTSATHDSGIGINKATKTLIHIIDGNIDEERGKVVSDLLLTGCVEGVELIDRPWITGTLGNATGDTLRTDRRMAVVKMNACTDPRRADTPDPELHRVRAKAIGPERMARDGFLYLRDDAFRGNLGYQSYSAGKMVWGMTHKKKTAEDDTQPKTITVVGEPYVVVSRPKATFLPKPGEFHDPGIDRPSFHLPGQERKDYRTKLEYSVSAGYSRFANRDFSTQPICVCVTPAYSSVGIDSIHFLFMQALHSGWSIAPRATLNSWRYFSNEFGYTYNKALLTIRSTSDNGDPPGVQYDDGQVRQFSYNLLLHARPNGARLRPYAAVGPVFQLLRLSDSVPPKNKALALTIKDAGLVLDAYNFGHTPPLEGGGLFQFGIQYGAGYKFQVTPRFLVRGDYRETVSPQPDYWAKSVKGTIADLNQGVTTYQIEVPAAQLGGPLRQRLFLTGFGISF